MASRSLSPKHLQERLQHYRHAVTTLAMFEAKKVIKANIAAKRRKLTQFSAKEITLLAEAELERNQAQVIAEAKDNIARLPVPNEKLFGQSHMSVAGESCR